MKTLFSLFPLGEANAILAKANARAEAILKVAASLSLQVVFQWQFTYQIITWLLKILISIKPDQLTPNRFMRLQCQYILTDVLISFLDNTSRKPLPRILSHLVQFCSGHHVDYNSSTLIPLPSYWWWTQWMKLWITCIQCAQSLTPILNFVVKCSQQKKIHKCCFLYHSLLLSLFRVATMQQHSQWLSNTFKLLVT